MGRVPFVPIALKRDPFTLEDARGAGLERWHLEGASWRRIGPATYVWAGLPETSPLKLEAVRPRLPAAAAFSGMTAAWLHGLDVEPCDPIEVTIPIEVGVSRLVGITIRRASLGRGDVTTVRGIRATSILRTLGDVCGRLSLIEAVVFADIALHARLVSLDQLRSWAHSHAGRAGIQNLRRAIGLVEPAAESPMESRLRMLLILGGLPRPKAQVSIHDRTGQFVGRPDLYYESCRLGIEYDGTGHRASLVEDNRRQNRLLGAGVRLLRFTAPDVLSNPDWVVGQVRAYITASGTTGGIRDRLNAAVGTKRGKYRQKNAIAS